jgi:hypothetical protein
LRGTTGIFSYYIFISTLLICYFLSLLTMLFLYNHFCRTKIPLNPANCLPSVIAKQKTPVSSRIDQGLVQSLDHQTSDTSAGSAMRSFIASLLLGGAGDTQWPMVAAP